MEVPTQTRSPEELQNIHDYMMTEIRSLHGVKFEVLLATARYIIRTDFQTVDLDNYNTVEAANNILQDIITIKIDPYSTPKKTYQDIIDNIYAAKTMNISIKDSTSFTKEQRLELLLEIDFQKHYLNKSQIDIGNYLIENNIAEISSVPSTKESDNYITAEEFSKEVNRYIKMAKQIRQTSNHISLEQFLVY